MIRLQPRLFAGTLREVILATAMAAVLVLAGVNYPPVTSLTLILWTLPISMIIIKRSLWFGLLVFGLTALLALLGSPNTATAVFMAQFIPVGLFYGISLRNNWHPGTVVSGGIVISILSLLLVILISFHSAGIPLSQLGQPLEEIYSNTMSLYDRTGILDNLQQEGVSKAEFESLTRQLTETFRQLLPGFMAMGAMVTALLNYLLLYLLGRRSGLEIRKLPPFSQWQLHWSLTWGVILGLIALLGGDYWQYQSVKLFGENLLLLFAPVLLVFGTSVAVFFYQKAPWPQWLKIGLIILGIFYIWFTVMMLMALGLFDPLFGYRKRIS